MASFPAVTNFLFEPKKHDTTDTGVAIEMALVTLLLALMRQGVIATVIAIIIIMSTVRSMPTTANMNPTTAPIFGEMVNVKRRVE
jgi:hypothetical protein